jgi:ATP-binding protein involved in chromosome partitioning
MCDALNIPLLGRIPFDRAFARTFDKGQPLLDASHPTIQRFQEIAQRVQSLIDYKKVLAEKL